MLQRHWSKPDGGGGLKRRRRPIDATTRSSARKFLPFISFFAGLVFHPHFSTNLEHPIHQNDFLFSFLLTVEVIGILLIRF
jgi:hypothetical protein